MAIKPIIDPAATLGETLLLVDVKPAYERIEKENGKFERTEKILNYVYTVVCVERKFEKVSIKIDEPRPLYERALKKSKNVLKRLREQISIHVIVFYFLNKSTIV